MWCGAMTGASRPPPSANFTWERVSLGTERRKRVLLTGCSGFVGRELVLELRSAGVDLVIVGRDVGRLADLFPGLRVYDYSSLEAAARGCDAVVHLAAINNNSVAPDTAFHEVNVDLTLLVAERVKMSGVPLFVHVTSFHALDHARTDPYSNSKRLAAERLKNVVGIDVITLFLPAVYGKTWSGKLSALNRLPPPLARAVFGLLSAWRPTVHVRMIASFLVDRLKTSCGGEVYLAEDLDRNRWYAFTKRTLDLAGATLVVVTLWWLLALIWACVRLDSSGPGIFAQRRVGRKGRVFTCYKFRTMRVGTQEAATHKVGATSVTRVGKFLRATKLDELPQVLNIFRGEMTFVGPRPCLPVQQELIDARREAGVHTLKPGITGLAQISGVDMSNPASLACLDSQYKARRSIFFDIQIAWATVLGRGGGDRVRAE